MRSNRISRLPRYKLPTTTTTAITTVPYKMTLTKPSHLSLQDVYNQLENVNDRACLDKISDICLSDWNRFDISDFSFILEMVQCTSTSQQEFWEFMATLIRFSIPHIKHSDERNLMEWKRTIAFAMIEVFWKQDQSVFIKQVKKLKTRPRPDIVIDYWGPFASDAEILSHTMIDSLRDTYYRKKALQLYGALSEHGIGMRSKTLETFISMAVNSGDGQQLERIGEMLLRLEELRHKRPLSGSEEEQRRNRPFMMPAKSMDSFIFGACNNGLYVLARAVFDKGLEANQKYRITTYTMILNSLSVNGFGFDIVEAENTLMKKTNSNRYSKNQGRPNRKSGVRQSPNSPKAIHVADPGDIERYIAAMEIQEIKPTIITLNVIAKLYLEMSLYKVNDSPLWKNAFTRYNPLDLKPDIVTYNTLLAYYEKQKDLGKMKGIYNSMANAQDEGRSVKQRKQRRQDKPMTNSQDLDHVAPESLNQAESSIVDDAKNHEQSLEETIYQPRKYIQPKQPYTRSNRDIYTYNTMLHALLKHAVETKDVTAIGQCFHDMEQDGISADTVTFNTNIIYHISRGDYDSAMQVFRSMDSNNIQEAGSQEFKLMAGPHYAGLSSKPRKSRPSTITKTMSDYIETTVEDESYSTVSTGQLEETPSFQVAKPEPMPDVITFTSLINGFAQSNDMAKATDMFMEMTKKFKVEPNLKTYTALAAGLHGIGDHVSAEKLWDEVAGDEEEGKFRSNTRRFSRHDKKDDRDSREQVDLEEEERAERQEQEQWKNGEAWGNLTIAERRQVKTIREMYKDPLKN
ncbi:hypothetical protein BGZ76_011017 [Entomortierella beljakovae]|nr:hypothetical protein BGZ76_011017 [Entomortierella beljakovae]